MPRLKQVKVRLPGSQAEGALTGAAALKFLRDLRDQSSIPLVQLDRGDFARALEERRPWATQFTLTEEQQQKLTTQSFLLVKVCEALPIYEKLQLLVDNPAAFLMETGTETYESLAEKFYERIEGLFQQKTEPYHRYREFATQVYAAGGFEPPLAEDLPDEDYLIIIGNVIFKKRFDHVFYEPLMADLLSLPDEAFASSSLDFLHLFSTILTFLFPEEETFFVRETLNFVFLCALLETFGGQEGLALYRHLADEAALGGHKISFSAAKYFVEHYEEYSAMPTSWWVPLCDAAAQEQEETLLEESAAIHA